MNHNVVLNDSCELDMEKINIVQLLLIRDELFLLKAILSYQSFY